MEIPHQVRKNNRVPRQRMQTPDVVRELYARGIVPDDIPVLEADVKNWHEHRRRGTWIFRKKSKVRWSLEKEGDDKIGTWEFEEIEDKSLDKPAEDVILTKEDKPAPKKRKSRAKKTTKK